jgi:hypothetical protein
MAGLDGPMNELQKIAERIRVSEDALRVLRTARDLIPEGEGRDAIDKTIRTSEDTLGQCRIRLIKLTEKIRKGTL